MSSPRQPAVSILRTAPRWETRAAIDRISALVDVSGDGQDWDIEQADPRRIAAFLTAYETGALDTAERHALMKLIVASLDDALRAGQHPPELPRIRAALVRDHAIHFHTITSWASLEDPVDQAHAATPLLRAVYFESTPPLLLAALADDLPALDAALAAAPPQPALDDALLAAATAASAPLLARLLAAGADVHARDQNDETPLLRAHDNLAALPVLLAAGADVNATNTLGWSALHITCLNGHADAARALLAHHARLDLRDDNGYDALMAAAECGHLELVDLLLAHGARVSATNRSGEDARGIARRHAEQAPADPTRQRIRLHLDQAAHPRP